MTTPSASTRGSLRQTLAPLLASHALGLLIPLLTVPYLARVLRPDGWGPVLVAQALVAWVGLLLEYGADLSGVRAVAAARARAPLTVAAMRATVWGVQGAKLLLLPAGLLLLAGVLLTLAPFRAAPALAAWTAVAALAKGFSPLWYFLGVERLKRAIAIDTGARILAALAVFPLVRNPTDGWKVLAAQATLTLVATLWLTRTLWREAPPPDEGIWSHAVDALRRGRSIFAYRVSGTIFLHGNTLLLGALAPAASVAAYGGAERVVRAAANLLEPLTRALLPRLSHLREHDAAEAGRFLSRLLPMVIGGALLGGIGIALTAPLLVRVLLGEGYELAIPLIRVLSLLLPIVATGTAIGFYWALPAGRDRLVLGATAAAGVLTLIVVGLLVPRYGAMGMAVAAVAAEATVALILTTAYRRRAR
ncbi:MAG: oligosaccharide flippase family protein [Gemmatimonadaceae bacterium]